MKSFPIRAIAVATTIIAAIFVYRNAPHHINTLGVKRYSTNALDQRKQSTMSFALNTMTLAGARGSYSINIDPNGNVNTIPVAGGATTNGTGIGLIQFSDVGIYVLNNTQAQVALLYEAALGREPDPMGLTDWVNTYNNLPSSVQSAGVYTALAETSGGFNGSLSIADGFIQSAEFQAKYGSLDNAGYVTQLYANVLHRTPDQGGMDTWMTALTPAGQTYTDPTSGQAFAGQGQSRAYVLVGFAESNENIADCAVTATTTSTSGWLVNTTTQGAYADKGALLTPTAGLNAALENGILNTATIDPSSISSTSHPPSNVDFQISNIGNLYYEADTENVSGVTIILSSGITHGGINGPSDSVFSAPSGESAIQLSTLAANTSIHLSGGHNSVLLDQSVGFDGKAYPVAQNSTISGYQPGSDTLGLPAIDNLFTNPSTGSHLPVSILTPSATSQVTGSALNFTQNSYVLNLGNVGDGSLASIAAAANQLYKVSDVNGVTTGSTPAAAAGENLTFIGTTAAGNTVIAQWADFSSANINGQLVPQQSADVNGNHQVDASEFTLLFTLVGVQANKLTAADFH